MASRGVNANARSISAAGIRLRATNCFEPLEDELRAKLHRSGIARVVDLTIRRAGNVCARERGEVRVVEDVENFPSQLDRPGFAEANSL